MTKADNTRGSRDTKTRILVSALVLFNDQGEPNTTTNEIANEADISPGNLHYHFRKKSELINALLAEFQADARRVLEIDNAEAFTLEDFWVRLHLLLEFTMAYHFMFRDTETLVDVYPGIARALRGFAKGLAAAFEIQLRALERSQHLSIAAGEVAVVSRNLVVLALFSIRYDTLISASHDAADSALRTARAILGTLRPYAQSDTIGQLDDLSSSYRP